MKYAPCHPPLAFCMQHSDLKPDNIMFHVTGRAVICDHGVSRITHGSTTSAYLGHGGTIIYLAPELLENVERSATKESDM